MLTKEKNNFKLKHTYDVYKQSCKIMYRLIFLIFLSLHDAVFTLHVINIKEYNSYCYAQDENPYKFYGTKTAYELVHGDKINSRIPKCRPVQFWSINRHGTRLPGKESIKNLEKLTQVQQEILNNYKNDALHIFAESKIGKMCDEDIQLLKNWRWNTSINQNTSSILTSQGWQDDKLLALRSKARFSDILSLPYTEKDFLFRYTRTQRTQASCEAFAEGLFGEEARNIHPVSFENDTLLETYKHCKFWQETVDKNPDSLIEYNKLLASDVYKNMMSEVSSRLGFRKTLNQSIIENMFDMCRFEQAWYIDDKSAWCSAFTREHLEVLEYAEDLLYYYLIGHGISLNAKVGCMPLKDLMARFENVVKRKSSEPKGIFYFTHSSSLQLLMVAMGMYKDSIPLKGDNMSEERNRMWRTSLIGPFAANIDAVLYRCTEGEEYRVAFYQNEFKYKFPECVDEICTWKQVKDRFGSAANSCNLDFCRNDDSIHRV